MSPVIQEPSHFPVPRHPARSRRRRLPAALAGVLLPLCAAAGAVQGQALERGLLVGDLDAGRTWSLDVAPQFRFSRSAGSDGVRLRTTFDFGLGLPAWTRAGVRYTPQSGAVSGAGDEWELHGRWAALAEARRAPLDATAQLAYNGTAGSVDGEVGIGRWLGPVRVVAAARAFHDAYGAAQARGAVAGGLVLAPQPDRLPIALTADAATLLDRNAGRSERVAWSAALNVGVAYSTHTLSLFATNTPSASLQGRSRGDTSTRAGFVFTAPIPLGRLLGLVASREAARRAVVEDAGPAADMVSAGIYRHAYVEYRLEVVAGTTIEWTNRDDVVHTVTADDRSWDSGAMQPGARWRARFDEPGVYPFHCGPHPYMKGVVVVRS